MYCRSKEEFSSFAVLGMDEYDKYVVAGIVSRQSRLNRLYGEGFGSIYEPRPDENSIARECQSILTFVRKKIFFDGDAGSNYEDYFCDEYADFFDPEQCEEIIKAFIEKNFIRPWFDVSKIGKHLGETLLGHAISDTQDISYYGKFVSDYYERLVYPMVFHRVKFEKEIEKEIPPCQYQFLQWLSRSNYKVADHKRDCGISRIRFVCRNNAFTELEMEKTSLRNAQYAVKNLEKWANSSRFENVLSSTFLSG